MRYRGTGRTLPGAAGLPALPGLSAIAVLVALVALLGATGARAQSAVTEGWVALRVLDLDVARGPVDVWLDGARILGGVRAGEPTAYVLVPAGAHRLEVAATGDAGGTAAADDGGVDTEGGDTAAPDAGAADAREPSGTGYTLSAMAAGDYLTLLLPPAGTDAGAGTEGAAGGANDAAEVRDDGLDAADVPVVQLVDPIATLPPAGRAGLRLVHAAPGVGRVALVQRDPDRSYDAPPPFASSDDGASDPVARLGPLKASDHAEVAAGSRALWLVREDGEPLLGGPLEVPLRSGTLYTLFLVPGGDGNGDGSARARLVVDATRPGAIRSGAIRSDPVQQDPAPASVRILHLSPDAPMVDVLIDGRLSLRDVAHRDRSGYVTLPSGRHEISVYPHRLPIADEGTTPPPAATSTTAPGAATEPQADTTAQPAAEPAGAMSNGEADAAADAGPQARPLEPVTALLDLDAGSYTTLALTGNFEPPSSAEGLGHLSLSVDPPDAQVSVTGPQGYGVQRQGEVLLRDLQPGTYRVEVRHEAFRAAEYQVEVQPGRTSVATLTLQVAEDAESAGAPVVAQEQQGPAIWQRLELQPYGGTLPLPRAGHALVRFVHVAPIVPPVAIAVIPVALAAHGPESPQRGIGRQGDAARSDAATAEASSGGTTVPTLRLESLSYPNPADFHPVVAGTHRIEFRVTGTDSVLHELPEVRLRPGAAYTLYLATAPEGGGLEVVPSVDALVPQAAPAGEEP